MIKRVFLISLLSLLGAGFILWLVILIMAMQSYKPAEVNLEKTLTNSSFNLARQLLVKLGYQIKTPYIKYNRQLMKIAVVYCYGSKEIEAILREWHDWFEPGKRLILLLHKSPEDNQPMILSVKDGRQSPYFQGISQISFSRVVGLPPELGEFTDLKLNPIWEEEGEILMATSSYKGAELLWLADATLFFDLRLIQADNAQFLNNCLRDYFPGPVVFELRAILKGKDNALRQAEEVQTHSSLPFFLEGLFLPLTLQLIGLLALFFLVYWKRWGPVRDMEKYSRRSLLLHLQAVANFFARCRRQQVAAFVLNRFFSSRLQDQLHLVFKSKGEIIAAVKKRLLLTSEELAAFEPKAASLVNQELLRESIIQRLKGVEKAK